MIVKAEIDDIELIARDGYAIDSTRATCTRCGNEEDSYGTSQGSVARCLMMLRESCPGGRRHFYEVEEGSSDGREKYETRYEGDPSCCFTAEGLAMQQRIEAAYRSYCGDAR